MWEDHLYNPNLQLSNEEFGACLSMGNLWVSTCPQEQLCPVVRPPFCPLRASTSGLWFRVVRYWGKDYLGNMGVYDSYKGVFKDL